MSLPLYNPIEGSWKQLWAITYLVTNVDILKFKYKGYKIFVAMHKWRSQIPIQQVLRSDIKVRSWGIRQVLTSISHPYN